MSKDLSKWTRRLVFGVVVGLALPFLVVKLTLPYILRNTDAYKIAADYITSDPIIRRTVGSPAQLELKSGRFFTRKDQLAAVFEVSVHGPTNVGSVLVTLTKQRGAWNIREAELRYPGKSQVKLR